MSRAWDIEAASHTEKLVLLALADNANDQGYCWPCLSTLARKSQLCERAVRQRIRDLEKKKWLTTKRRPGHSSAYWLKIPTPAPDAGLPRHAMPDTPACGAPPPRHAMPPEPSFEPSKNHHPGVSAKAFSLKTKKAAIKEKLDSFIKPVPKEDVSKFRELKALYEKTNDELIALET